MVDDEVSSDAKIDDVFEFVDIVAKSLGYKYVSLQSCSRSSRRCVCVFRRGECSDYLKMKTADGQLVVVELDMPSSTGKTPLYRLYNPNASDEEEAGAHHYTKDNNERNSLISIGWNDEEIGWYGM